MPIPPLFADVAPATVRMRKWLPEWKKLPRAPALRTGPASITSRAWSGTQVAGTVLTEVATIMHPSARMRQYQRQAIASSSPAQLVLKLYDLGIQSCRQDDRARLRRVLAELVGSLNLEEGGEIAERLYDLYEFCINESVTGDLDLVQHILRDLRDVWKQAILDRQAA